MSHIFALVLLASPLANAEEPAVNPTKAAYVKSLEAKLADLNTGTGTKAAMTECDTQATAYLTANDAKFAAEVQLAKLPATDSTPEATAYRTALEKQKADAEQTLQQSKDAAFIAGKKLNEIRWSIRGVTCELAMATHTECIVRPTFKEGRFWSKTHHRLDNGVTQFSLTYGQLLPAQRLAMRIDTLPDEFNQCYPYDWFASSNL